jgi:hypothetical protein
VSEETFSKKFKNVTALLWKTKCPKCEFGHIAKAWQLAAEQRKQAGVGTLLAGGCDRCGFRCFAYHETGEYIEYETPRRSPAYDLPAERCMICGGEHWVNDCKEDITKFKL